MSQFSAIDLSQLPAPDLIETLDYEAILAALLAEFTALYPDFTAALESEPVVKLLEASAYRELILRARINAAARGCVLAFATGADLDQLGAWWGVARRLLDAGDPEAVPPVAATYETDAAFRAQIQSSLEARTTAGPIGSYRWHALQADATLLDCGISSPIPGTVRVSVLAAEGTPDAEQLAAVTAALSAETVRPLCDTVLVEAATLTAYDVTATLHLASGPDPDAVEAAALAAVDAYCQAQRQCGARIARSALFAALQQPGVQWVDLSAPAADLVTDATAAPWPGTVTLTIEQAAA